MFVLDTMLKLAAEREWQHVVQRCAWCGRIADRDGNYVIATVVNDDTVFTDGMCPACARNALAALANRRPRRQLLAAAA